MSKNMPLRIRLAMLIAGKALTDYGSKNAGFVAFYATAVERGRIDHAIEDASAEAWEDYKLTRDPYKEGFSDGLDKALELVRPKARS